MTDADLVPQWWKRPDGMSLEEWATRYNATHPMPELEIELRLKRLKLATDIARIDALLRQCEASHLNTLKNA